ncbi:MAG: presenilin family intramembrane aspartyl protease [Candidatus Micrarchaeales archaeon]
MSALDTRQDIRILTLFLIVQFAGLFLATQLYSGATVEQVSVSPNSAVLFPVTYIIFIIGFSIIMLLLLRRGIARIMVLLEGFAILVSSYFFFIIIVSIIGSYFPNTSFINNQNYQIIAAAIFGFAVVLFKNKNPRSRNTVSIIASISIGVIIGLGLSFETALIFMIILAVYDFIAVFITKHMVAMGQAAVEMNLAFLIMTSEGEAVPASTIQKKHSGVFSSMRNPFSKYKNTVKELKKEGLVPILRPRALGNGDLAVPLMVAVSAYSQFLTFTVSFVIIFGAAFGLVMTFFILGKYKRPLPAIPPLLFGILLALSVYFIATGAISL